MAHRRSVLVAGRDGEGRETERGSAIAVKTQVDEVATPVRVTADEDGGGEAVVMRTMAVEKQWPRR